MEKVLVRVLGRKKLSFFWKKKKKGIEFFLFLRVEFELGRALGAGNSSGEVFVEQKQGSGESGAQSEAQHGGDPGNILGMH